MVSVSLVNRPEKKGVSFFYNIEDTYLFCMMVYLSFSIENSTIGTVFQNCYFLYLVAINASLMSVTVFNLFRFRKECDLYV